MPASLPSARGSVTGADARSKAGPWQERYCTLFAILVKYGVYEFGPPHRFLNANPGTRSPKIRIADILSHVERASDQGRPRPRL